MELNIEIMKIVGADKVNEPVPNITIILQLRKKYFKITGQIKKVISIGKIEINLFSQVFNSIFVWYISDHDGSSWIIANIFSSNLEIII
jgi:hypothetical protein